MPENGEGGAGENRGRLSHLHFAGPVCLPHGEHYGGLGADEGQPDFDFPAAVPEHDFVLCRERQRDPVGEEEGRKGA